MNSDHDNPRHEIEPFQIPPEDAIAETQKRLTLFVSYIAIANLMGMLSCISVWRLYYKQGDIQNILMTSAMIFGLGMVAALISYAVFRSSIALSHEAGRIVLAAGGDEAQVKLASESQDEALRRIQSGMRVLKMSGICFVASALIGISSLLSI